MIINEEMKSVVKNSAFLTIVTIGLDGLPHPIIVGRGAVENDTITVGVYAMKVTQENLKKNDWAMMLAAQTMEGGAQGCRVTGNAKIVDDQFIFTATKAETLL